MGTDAISPLRQRMIEDMAARKLGPHSLRSHIDSCKRFAAFLGRSPDTATADVPCWPPSPKNTGDLSRTQLRRQVGRRLPLDVMQPDGAVHATSAPSGQKVRPAMAGSENGMLGYPQLLRKGQMIRSWRMASETVCVRLRVPSFVSAFLK
jgi:hypothetical protein